MGLHTRSPSKISLEGFSIISNYFQLYPGAKIQMFLFLRSCFYTFQVIQEESWGFKIDLLLTIKHPIML